jgi:hypothetical protein
MRVHRFDFIRSTAFFRQMAERANVFGQTSKSDRRASMLIRSDVPLMMITLCMNLTRLRDGRSDGQAIIRVAPNPAVRLADAAKNILGIVSVVCLPLKCFVRCHDSWLHPHNDPQYQVNTPCLYRSTYLCG